ncbi:hypothetical protein SVAN01_06929 [Stagonosporopsis vannaccii]|nr:hypothetical protein SVAN01_06929 [Stagonosporopsis vannaccii]
MSQLPIPPSTIDTPRLRLVRLTNTEPGSRHVQWFHENWSDPVATGWRYRPHIPHPSSYAISTYPLPMLLALKYQSLRGATKSLEESRLWMIEHMKKWDNWFYAVFLHDESKESEKEEGKETDGGALGTHIGSVSLRLPPVGLELPPPRSFDGAAEVGTGEPLSEEEFKEREDALKSVDLQLRVLGYALFAHAHGKGYGTEACRGLLEGYAGAVKEWTASRQSGTNAEREADKKAVFYVEAGVDQENPGSQHVLRKLGFRTVGLKIEKEKAWLNGAWRGPGWWITGMYL